jgi:hypothetical protein
MKKVLFFLLCMLPFLAYVNHCTGFVCADFQENVTTKRVEVTFTAQVISQKYYCFISVAGAKRYFILQGNKGPFRHPWAYSWTQYSWRCDPEGDSGAPMWFPKY